MFAFLPYNMGNEEEFWLFSSLRRIYAVKRLLEEANEMKSWFKNCKIKKKKKKKKKDKNLHNIIDPFYIACSSKVTNCSLLTNNKTCGKPQSNLL